MSSEQSYKYRNSTA